MNTVDRVIATMNARVVEGLPSPSPDERALSDRLVARIVQEITKCHAIDFARFMELALYTPGLGYYSAGRQKFGEGGDFVTAPELSPLFSRMLARQCAEILLELSGGDILEFGAGSGAMAATILAELQALNAVPRRYAILELSPDLRQRQQALIRERLPALFPRVEWLDQLPGSFRGVVLGNEVLDAMPVQCFIVTSDGARLLEIAQTRGRFFWQLGAVARDIDERIAAYALPIGYVSETNGHAEAWVRSIGDRLEAGAILLVDYGFPRAEFYHPQRSTGTLMCHYRHRAHGDPLINIGLQDITAHVDFTAMAEAASSTGLDVLGYSSQAAFLLSLGIADAINDSTQPLPHLILAQQIKKLTLPSEMGELFKVIAFGRGLASPLRGFQMQDRRSRL